MLEQAPWPDPPRPGDDVTAWLAQRAHAFRRALLSHRDGARVHAGTRPDGPQRFPWLEAARDVNERQDPDADCAFGLQALIAGLQHTTGRAGRAPDADGRPDQ